MCDWWTCTWNERNICKYPNINWELCGVRTQIGGKIENLGQRIIYHTPSALQSEEEDSTGRPRIKLEYFLVINDWEQQINFSDSPLCLIKSNLPMNNLKILKWRLGNKVFVNYRFDFCFYVKHFFRPTR